MAKKGKKKKFPDLTGDGKVTRADILKGRGVIESDNFIDEVMNRVEENILLEDEFFKMLEGLEEKGYDVESLTEEELNELFYKLRKGLKKASGGRFDLTTAKEDRMERAQKRMNKRRTKDRTSRINKELMNSIERRKAAKQRAAEEPAATTPADRTPKGPKGAKSGEDVIQSGFGAGVSVAGTGGKLKRKVRVPRKLGRRGIAASTSIVRGARLALAERVLSELNLDETFQALNMKRRAGRVDRVLKGREKQEKRTGPQGLAGKLLGRKYDADANQRAERKKRDLEARRGRGAALDRAEQERRGGGTYTKDGRRVDKALKKQRKTRGEKIYKDSDVEREDLPPSPRIQRRRAKVDAEVERKRERRVPKPKQ